MEVHSDESQGVLSNSHCSPLKGFGLVLRMALRDGIESLCRVSLNISRTKLSFVTEFSSTEESMFETLCERRPQNKHIDYTRRCYQ